MNVIYNLHEFSVSRNFRSADVIRSTLEQYFSSRRFGWIKILSQLRFILLALWSEKSAFEVRNANPRRYRWRRWNFAEKEWQLLSKIQIEETKRAATQKKHLPRCIAKSVIVRF